MTDQDFAVGQKLEPSRVWIDNEPTDIELPGTSVIDLQMVDYVTTTYPGRHVYLVAGEPAGWGEDVGERILANAVVLATLQ